MRGVTAPPMMFCVESIFQPALPMRGVTLRRREGARIQQFQPALPMRGVTKGFYHGTQHDSISTRTPHAGSDSNPFSSAYSLSLFQPALPMRGVTVLAVLYSARVIFQPALPMRGVTPFSKPAHPDTRISTRTPHAGSDRNIMCKFTASINI